MLQITKPARAPQRVVIGAKVPQEMKAQLERAAKANGVSASVLIEQALAHVLDLLEKQDAAAQEESAIAKAAAAQEESAIAKAAPTKRGRPRKGAKQ